MLLLARKNLLVHTGRFGLALVGITSSVVLVLLLMGLYAGWSDNMAAYFRHVEVDLWVGRGGSSDLFHTLSLLPTSEESLLRNTEGVASVSSFIGRLIESEVRGQRTHTYIVGVDDERNGPVRIIEGRTVQQDGEIVIDHVFARNEKLYLGDSLTAAGEALRVVGIAQDGNCFLYQYSFVTLAQARQLFDLAGQVNFFHVRLTPTADIAEVASRIEDNLLFVSVFSKEQFLRNNLSLTGDNFLPILRVLEIIGVLVGITVISLTVYTLTVERSSEYGVLKAVGAPDRVLYWTAAQQAVVCGLFGWFIGVPLNFGVVQLAQYLVPEFPANFYPQHAVWMLGGTLGMSLIAAVIPVRHITRIDPLVAFKG